MGTTASIRPAAPYEAPALSELAQRSKAHWGYSDEELELFRPELTLEPDDVRTFHTHVAEVEGRIAGFYTLVRQSPDEVELQHLFVEPDRLQAGIGGALFRHARGMARRLGFTDLVIHSEPAALSFYERQGARHVRDLASQIPGRMLPVLVLPLVSNEPAEGEQPAP